MKKIARSALLAFPLLIRPTLETTSCGHGMWVEDSCRTEAELDPKRIDRTRWKHIPLGALALICLFFEPTTAKLLQCQEPPVEQQVSIPFTTAYGNVDVALLLVQASINGKPATLIFDTGAQFLTITPELAEGLQPIGTAEHIGLGVKTISSRVIVPVKLGGVTLPHCAAETQDLSGLSDGLGVKIDGLIGESVLSRFKAVTIDYTNHMVDFVGI